MNGECSVPTPPVCIDDDPCTDDTCSPTGGCPHARKTGFPGISCRIEFIESAAGGATVADLPTKLRAKILALSAAARTRITDAETEPKVKKQRKLLKASEGKLGKLLSVISKGLKKKQIKLLRRHFKKAIFPGVISGNTMGQTNCPTSLPG